MIAELISYYPHFSQERHDFPGRPVSSYVPRISLPNLATVIPVINRSYVNRTVRRFLGRKESHGRRSASVNWKPRRFQSHAFPASVRSVLHLAIIKPPMAFVTSIVSRRESGAKVRTRRRYPPKGFSASP